MPVPLPQRTHSTWGEVADTQARHQHKEGDKRSTPHVFNLAQTEPLILSSNFDLKSKARKIGPRWSSIPKLGEFIMRRISAFLQALLFTTLLFAGLYLLFVGSSNKSQSEVAMLLAGAVCITLSAMTLVSAVRSTLWHRQMRRHSPPNHGEDAHFGDGPAKIGPPSEASQSFPE